MITGFSCKWTHLILGIFILVSAALFQVASVAYASPVNILSVFLCVFSFISSTVGGIILTKAFETDKNFINAVCKFFNKKSVQIVEANSHISG